MFNTGLIFGVTRDYFEIELKKATENIKKTKFKNSEEAFEAAIDYFFMNYPLEQRSDSNHNSCMVIKAYEASNKLDMNEVKLKREDFAEYIKQCKHKKSGGQWLENKISLAFKNMAKNIKFEDVKVFVMNYS